MKPIIMILGSSHLSNPGWNGVNPKIDDVLTPKRQAEIEQLVAQLGKFQPTKIALEIDVSRDAEINASYQGYLEGTYELKRYESDQIGFRLAKQMEHSKVYCVDYFREDPIVRKDIDERLVDYDAFAETNGQKHLLSLPSPTEGKITQDADGRTWIVREKYEPMVDMYIRINQDEGIRKKPPRLLKDCSNRSARRIPWSELGCTRLVSSKPQNFRQPHANYGIRERTCFVNHWCWTFRIP